MKKRVLSILCVLALCLGMLPATALAADGDLVATVKIGEGETQYCVGTEEGNYDTAEAALKAAWSDCLNKTATLTLHKSVELSSSSQLSINYYTNSNTNLTLKMDNGVKLSKTLPISGGTPILVNDGTLNFASGTIEVNSLPYAYQSSCCVRVNYNCQFQCQTSGSIIGFL